MNFNNQFDVHRLANLDLDFLLHKSLTIFINIIIALSIFFIGKFIAKRILQILQAMMRKSKIDSTLIAFFDNVLYGGLMAIVIIASLSYLGLNTTSLVAMIGGASVAIGLALQGQLSNFASGIVIILFRPFNVGDYINVHGEKGTVKTISLINTSMVTLDNHEIIIPNNQITSDWLINYSSIPNYRVEILIGIGYNSNIDIARKLMLAEADKHSLVLSQPKAKVVVKDLADSSVNLALFVWTENSDHLTVEFDLREAIKKAFDQHGIEIPFPQQVVHLPNTPFNQNNQAT